MAELGRPETAEETAARKAEDSHNHRERQTANNLVLSLLATVGLVIFIVLIVPRGNQNLDPLVDFTAAAQQVRSSISEPVAVPELPSEWKANLAQLRTGSDGVQSWNIGLITPDNRFIALSQGMNAGERWLRNQLPDVSATAQKIISGVNWTVYDDREASNGKGNLQYALSTATSTSTYVLYGTGSDTEFRTVAATISDEIKQAR